MGLVIISTGDQEIARKSPEKNPDCIVCTAERPDGFANDIEKIFWALNQIPLDKLSDADAEMCAPHRKKAKGMKIFASKDELFELSSNSNLQRDPQAIKITEEEYNKEAEIEDGKAAM